MQFPDGTTDCFIHTLEFADNSLVKQDHKYFTTRHDLNENKHFYKINKIKSGFILVKTLKPYNPRITIEAVDPLDYDVILLNASLLEVLLLSVVRVVFKGLLLPITINQSTILILITCTEGLDYALLNNGSQLIVKDTRKISTLLRVLFDPTLDPTSVLSDFSGLVQLSNFKATSIYSSTVPKFHIYISPFLKSNLNIPYFSYINCSTCTDSPCDIADLLLTPINKRISNPILKFSNLLHSYSNLILQDKTIWKLDSDTSLYLRLYSRTGVLLNDAFFIPDSIKSLKISFNPEPIDIPLDQLDIQGLEEYSILTIVCLFLLHSLVSMI